jgi:hypothetical protein
MKTHIKNRLSFFLFLSFLMGLASSTASAATLLHNIKSKFSLPNSSWVWDSDYKKEGDKLFGMYVEKLGQSVNFRVNYYEVPYSAKEFLEAVRAQLEKKPDYQGADFSPVTSREISGKKWDLFRVKRKDGIQQELWNRKGETDTVLFVLYTADGDYFDQYYKDFSTLMQQASSF